MRLCSVIFVSLGVLTLSLMPPVFAQEAPDYTCFQTASQWNPKLDIGSQVAIVYGINPSFEDRVALWREKGYSVSMMTGISWGGYDEYYMIDGKLKTDEIQTEKNGKLWMHGHSTTVGYNVPSPEYIDYIKKLVSRAVAQDVRAIYMEEPEYWAVTGWSEGFKKEWQRFYGVPWEAPDSSVDAQYKASLLKYELYFNALREVFRHIKAEAKARGIEVECHVPTHSLNNYAQWRIVSPESHLMDLEEMDGYIAQVWTGTARSHNIYRGISKSRTFEAAYLEYGQALGMVRPTGRKVWFLADPIEDNPDRSWDDYKRNYECTIIGSLFWPEVHRFEVMPWPSRIFQGSYYQSDEELKDQTVSERKGIPSEYATQILSVINTLNDMNQEEVTYTTGTSGVGVLISDTIMFQRAAPHPSDAHLGSFFGLALPLVKHGLPAEVVQLENVLHPNTLPRYKVLLLTYEGQKPLKPEYHAALAQWVRDGGCLLYVGDGTDEYHNVKSWWNNDGAWDSKAYEDLFLRMGLYAPATDTLLPVGKGFLYILDEKPHWLTRQEDGAAMIMAKVDTLLQARGEALETQHYLELQRGPYLIASVLDESISETPWTKEGNFVDIFDPMLPVKTLLSLGLDERGLWYDLDWLQAKGIQAKVVAAAMRIRDEEATDSTLTFIGRGPENTIGRVRALLPDAPTSVTTTPEVPVKQEWDATSSTLWLEWPNQAQDVQVAIQF